MSHTWPEGVIRQWGSIATYLNTSNQEKHVQKSNAGLGVTPSDLTMGSSELVANIPRSLALLHLLCLLFYKCDEMSET